MKKERSTGWSEDETEAIIGNLLRVGVFSSALIVVIGGILYLIQYGSQPPHHQIFRGEPEVLRTIPGILNGVLAGNSRAIIQFGLLLLVATPVARVIFSVYAFARERDRLYVGITLVVLAVLLYSMISEYLPQGAK